MDNLEKTSLKDLYKAILALKTAEECSQFLGDLCTPAELISLADRWRVAKLVNKKIPYREIHNRTGVSTATITRVARCLQYGEGGYRLVLDRSKRQG